MVIKERVGERLQKTRRIAYLGLMLALALLAGYLERLVPPPVPALPGIKLGLANTVILAVLYLFDTKQALLLNLLRILLSALLFSGVWGALYALSGAFFSFFVMVLLKKSLVFGIVGVSVAGGSFHNLGQICFAAIIMENRSLFYYLPVLLVSGLLAGIFVGCISGLCINRLRAGKIV